MRQSLRHSVAKAPWRDEALLEQVCNYVLPATVVAWIVGDTGFSKKGKHSVGVNRQYCGQVGKQENCRVAVSLSMACGIPRCPPVIVCTCRRNWAEDVRRRKATEVPEEVGFQTKPAIALEQIRAAVAANLTVALFSLTRLTASNRSSRRLTQLGLQCVVGVQNS